MVRSRLPVPSLLGLTAALLVLSPELLTGRLPYVPLTDPEVRVPLAIAVEHYNRERTDWPNYYKVASLRKERYKVGGSVEVHFKVLLVKTACEKKAGWLIYRRFQKCEQLPGNQEKPVCYFNVISNIFPPRPMELISTVCG